MKPSTLTLSLDLGILGEQSAEVTFYYQPGFVGTREDPPEPEYVEIEDIALTKRIQGNQTESVSILPWLEPDTLRWLETLTLERFLAEAESAATDAAIDRYEERYRYETD